MWYRLSFLLLATGVLTLAHAGGLRFSDQTGAAGVDFVHHQVITHRAGPMTGGGAVGDFNGDGYPDLFVIGGGGRADALFINRRDGTFVDQSEAWGLSELHRGTGATVGDYDGDGDDDLYVTSLGSVDAVLPAPGQHRLYRNDGEHFTDVAQSAGVHWTADHPDGFGAAFGDYDLDGDLDLFVAGWHGIGAEGALGSRLFGNSGDGSFEDVTETAGLIQSSTHAFGAIFADMNGDRYPELLVPGDFGTSRYYRNMRNGTFLEIDPGTGVAPILSTDPNWSIGKAHNAMGTAVADIDGDGRPDWLMTAIWPTFQFESPFWGNGLYLNRGDDIFAQGAQRAGIADSGWAWGVAAADFDHDGRPDVLVTNGWPTADTVTGEVFDDEPAYLFSSRHGLDFADYAGKVGLQHTQQGRGLVTLDYDRDGDLDVVIFSNQQPLRLYRNELVDTRRPVPRDAHWLQVVLDTTHRPDLAPGGLGAHIRVRAGGAVQHAWMTGGGTYLGRSEALAHFGLQRARRVDELTVAWPDGTHTGVRGIPANQRVVLRPHRPAPLQPR